MTKAKILRQQFKAIPQDQRNAHQNFSIRVWRALSWLERAESLDAADIEGRFISCWIGFNSLYGRLDHQKKPWGDREAWGAFLAQIWRLDDQGTLRRILNKRQLQVLKLIENKFLSYRYWEDGETAANQVKKELRRAMAQFGKTNMLPVLQLLFDRLYIMRVQVFHGASTKGSSINRRTLQGSTGILLDLLPEMLAVMIAKNTHGDWGTICFPPS